jgi:hypothetical protein
MNTTKQAAIKVDWSSMSDAQLRFQADCFELHGERIPRALQAELDKRAEANFDPEGSTRIMQQGERNVGA